MTILDTGWVNPGTTANQGSGTFTWSNTDNVKVSDDNDATISGHSVGNTSDELLVTNFGFSIPDNATIIGVEVRAESRTDINYPGGTGIRFFNFYESVGGFFLFYNGSNIGDKYSNGIYFTTVETQLSAGGSTSMWGYTITPAIVNHSTFGFSGKVTWNMFGSGTAELDNMQMKIYYELPVKNIEKYWWKINEGTGNPVDYGTAGVDLVNTNASWTTGGKIWDDTLVFNGTDSYLQMTNVTNMSSDTIGSFSNWVYIDGDNDALNLIFNVQNYALSTYLGLYCSTVGATTTWAAGLVADGTALWDFMYSGGSPIDTWVHVVLTHDGTTPKLYINGTNVNITFNVETDKTAWMKTMFDGISPPSIFVIGAFLAGGNPIYILRGNSQDFRYFNETFNQSEIDYLNNSGNGRTESLSKFSPPQFKNILKLQNKSNILPGIKIPVRF